MTPPRLSVAQQNGQTAVRVVFNQRMRVLGATAPEDPQNKDLWTISGGVTATAVTRLNEYEFEVHLSGPLPVANGYTIAVALTAESMLGEAIDPAYASTTFDVTVADLTVASTAWTAATTLKVTLSEALVAIQTMDPSTVVRIDNVDLDARQIRVATLAHSTDTITLTMDEAGTAGARYRVTFVRSAIVSLASSTSLALAHETLDVLGQGAQPSIASLQAAEDALAATGSELLGWRAEESSWPKFIGAYAISQGDLGTVVEPDADSPTVVRFPGARLPVGANVTLEVARTTRTVVAGQSFSGQASSSVGAAVESTGGGSTTVSKTVGSPYEVVFSGGVDSLDRAGRAVEGSMSISFTPSGSAYPLVAFTFLNSQVSVVIGKTTTNMADIKLYRGAKLVGQGFKTFDPTSTFNLDVIDATADASGYFAVAIDGEVIAGARAQDLVDPLLTNTGAGATAIALTFGSPAASGVTFDVEFTTDLVVQSFMTTGLRGAQSGDLLSFTGSRSTATVGASATPTSGGFNNTGKPAFAVVAQYAQEVDGIQVVVGLNPDAAASAFTGSVSLLAPNESVMDQVLFDRSYMLVDGACEIVVTFMHPKAWLNTLVGVSVVVGGSTYSVKVPVTTTSDPAITGQLTQQPASWFAPRVDSVQDLAGAPSFGPAVALLTP